MTQVNDQKNLRSIKQLDEYAKEIIEHCTHATLFEFDVPGNKWKKTETEGPLFIYKRINYPYYSLIIANRQSLKDFTQPITDNISLKYEPPYIFVQNERGIIRGVWIYGEDDCKRIFNTLTLLKDKPKDECAILPSNAAIAPKVSPSSIVLDNRPLHKEIDAKRTKGPIHKEIDAKRTEFDANKRILNTLTLSKDKPKDECATLPSNAAIAPKVSPSSIVLDNRPLHKEIDAKRTKGPIHKEIEAKRTENDDKFSGVNMRQQLSERSLHSPVTLGDLERLKQELMEGYQQELKKQLSKLKLELITGGAFE